MTTCKAVPARAYRKTAIEVVEDKLVRLGTHPEIITIIITALTLEENKTMPTILSQDNEIKAVIEEQHRIGWHLVQLGILSLKWGEFHQRYQHQKTNTANPNLATYWGQKIQPILW